MEQLLELVKSDRSYGNDACRNGLLKMFEMIDDEELVADICGLCSARCTEPTWTG